MDPGREHLIIIIGMMDLLQVFGIGGMLSTLDCGM